MNKHGGGSSGIGDGGSGIITDGGTTFIEPYTNDCPDKEI